MIELIPALLLVSNVCPTSRLLPHINEQWIEQDRGKIYHACPHPAPVRRLAEDSTAETPNPKTASPGK